LLVELLAVIAIIGMMSGAFSMAIGYGRSTSLVAGGDLVTNLAAFARQTAMTKNTMTALVLPANQGTAGDYRSFAVVEYKPGFGWSQITSWQALPTGVVVDTSEECTFLTNSPNPFPNLDGPPRQSNPPFSYQGAAITNPAGYAARIFLPSGGLSDSESPAQIRLVEGSNQGGRTVYAHASGGKPANYFDVALLGATGLAKTSRP
ncbi:MAG: hypothetical protein PHQ12_10275, partial [Chthoniobacteraceae bacterium]|nr:hypothetical protein [Chthoniobacteraceae bacterium]